MKDGGQKYELSAFSTLWEGSYLRLLGCMGKTDILINRTNPLAINFSKTTFADGVFQRLTAFKIPRGNIFVAFRGSVSFLR